MKSFQKFIVLTFLSYAIFAILFFSLLGKAGIFDQFMGNLPFIESVLFSGYFFVASISYVYIFEILQQKKESILRNLMIAAGCLFILVLVLDGLFLIYAFTVNENRPPDIISDYFFCICIFTLEYLGTTLLAFSSKSYKLVFDEKKLFYLKLILSISTIVSIFGMISMWGLMKNTFNNYDYLSVNKLIPIFFKIGGHCLLVTSVSLFFIWGLSRFSWFKKNNLFIVLLLFLTQMVLLNLQIQVYEGQVLRAFFDFSTLSAPLLMVVLLYRNEQKTTAFKIKKLTSDFSKKEAEYLQLKNQVNPHFLFNNLNTLISFIEINPKKAIEFGHHLSNTYRHYLKNKTDDFVSLKEELEFIKEYLEIYKAKFENSFSFEISVVPKENEYIVCLSLQEIVDNIFKHNTMDENNPLEIRISSVENGLLIENTVSNKANDQSNGVGLENINKRYTILTNKEIQIIKNTNSYQVILPILELEA